MCVQKLSQTQTRTHAASTDFETLITQQRDETSVCAHNGGGVGKKHLPHERDSRERARERERKRESFFEDISFGNGTLFVNGNWKDRLKTVNTGPGGSVVSYVTHHGTAVPVGRIRYLDQLSKLDRLPATLQ